MLKQPTLILTWLSDEYDNFFALLIYKYEILLRYNMDIGWCIAETLHFM